MIKTKLREITKLPRQMVWAMVMEGVETTRMVKVFLKHGRGKLRLVPSHRNPTPEQLKEAVEQLKDLPRFLPFFVVVVVPVPGITEGYAVVALTLERWLGDRMKILPSQFRHILRPEAPLDVSMEAPKQAEGPEASTPSSTARLSTTVIQPPTSEKTHPPHV
jgi:hypothetical protein